MADKPPRDVLRVWAGDLLDVAQRQTATPARHLGTGTAAYERFEEGPHRRSSHSFDDLRSSTQEPDGFVRPYAFVGWRAAPAFGARRSLSTAQAAEEERVGGAP
jgi:hypothetical protein